MPFHGAAQAADGGGSGQLIGSWDGTIDFFGQPFRALYSFLPAGVMLEADNPALDPNFGNLAFSPGHGTWKNVPGGATRATYQKFAYDAAGALTLMARSTLEVVVGPDGSLTGTLDLRLLTPDGVLVSEYLGLGFTAVPIEVDE
jgi:hypothetical protein